MLKMMAVETVNCSHLLLNGVAEPFAAFQDGTGPVKVLVMPRNDTWLIWGCEILVRVRC